MNCSPKNTINVYDQAALYCAAFSYPVDDEVDWVIDQVQHRLNRTPKNVLEPMCGNARYGEVLHNRKLSYFGFDVSASMVERAQEHEGLQVWRADAIDFSVDDVRFDFAWCPINSIRHLLCAEDVVKHLALVARHLEPDGIYIIETDLMNWNGSWPTHHAGEWDTPQSDGSVVRARWWVDRCERERRRQWEGCSFERLVDGERVAFVESQYEMLMTTAADWSVLSERSGFKIVSVFEQVAADQRDEVALSSALENTGKNYTLVLQRQSSTGDAHG